MNVKLILSVGIIACLLLPAIQSEHLLPEKTSQNLIPSTFIQSMGSQYRGTLRIYIVEIESRWDMENGAPYHYAFYDFAFNDDIEIAYLETYEDSITWQGDVTEDNVLILAALFNEESYRNYADPPLGSPFDAHYVDAAAGVYPGETESNANTEDFTHTVFCEVGSATWCSNCPGMADALKSVFTHNDLPFYFVEMVTDVNNLANSRMTDYSLRYLPTGFYDGGYEVAIGGGLSSSDHKAIIEEMGKRGVHDLDFTLSSTWVDEGVIDIFINITNNEALPNTKPDTPTIQGPEDGSNQESLSYEISTTDPDGDQVWFKIDWGDDTVTDWIGPYDSGEVTTQNHTWAEQGTYIIKVKAKDPDGAETEWVWHKVTLPKSKRPFLSLYQWLIEQFPILEELINVFVIAK